MTPFPTSIDNLLAQSPAARGDLNEWLASLLAEYQAAEHAAADWNAVLVARAKVAVIEDITVRMNAAHREEVAKHGYLTQSRKR